MNWLKRKRIDRLFDFIDRKLANSGMSQKEIAEKLGIRAEDISRIKASREIIKKILRGV